MLAAHAKKSWRKRGIAALSHFSRKWWPSRLSTLPWPGSTKSSQHARGIARKSAATIGASKTASRNRHREDDLDNDDIAMIHAELYSSWLVGCIVTSACVFLIIAVIVIVGSAERKWIVPASFVELDLDSSLGERASVETGLETGLPLHFASLDVCRDSTFPHGVSAGDPRADSVTLWTFYGLVASRHGSGNQRPFIPPPKLRVTLWKVAPDESLARASAVGAAMHSPTHARRAGAGGDASANPATEVEPSRWPVEVTPAGYAKYRAIGLEPDTEYAYAFFAGDLCVSPCGRVRTAFAPDSAPQTFNVVAAVCSDLTYIPFEALMRSAAHIASQQAGDAPGVTHALLHLGDFSYNDHALSLDDYRAVWKRTLDDPGVAALLPRLGLYWTRDDHEFADNQDTETDGHDRYFGTQRWLAATRAYFEALPIEGAPGDVRLAEGADDDTLAVDAIEAPSLWGRSFVWGRSVEIFRLDCRSERRPSTRDGAGATYISDEQLRWLLHGLESSSAVFKIVMNSVPITLLTSGPLSFDLVASDRWQGYPAQRTALLDGIEAAGVRNVYFLSGDVHYAFIARTQSTNSGPWEIAIGPTDSGPAAAYPFDDKDRYLLLTHAGMIRVESTRVGRW